MKFTIVKLGENTGAKLNRTKVILYVWYPSLAKAFGLNPVHEAWHPAIVDTTNDSTGFVQACRDEYRSRRICTMLVRYTTSCAPVGQLVN